MQNNEFSFHKCAKYALKVFSVVMVSVVLSNTIQAQPCAGTTGASTQAKKCFEIVSILVDACDGNNEGQNEMIRLDIGPNDITIANIGVPKYVTGRVNWGANAQNPFLGFATYTATTTNKIKQLNQTIASAGNCGLLIAVNGNGKLPARSKVLIITSEAFNPSAHDFSDLQDTLYVLLQKQGNTAGHFVNHSTAAGLRELILTYGGCGDTVEYDRTKLKKQNLSVGAEDGAVVDFTYNGVATYTNYGCRIPVPKIVVKATTPAINFCGGGVFPVYGTVSGSPCFRWSLADTTQATIADHKAINTQIRIKSGVSGKVKVYLNAWGSCAKAKRDSVMVSVSSPPSADFTLDVSATPLICFKRSGVGSGPSWRWGFLQSSDITATNPRGSLWPDSATSSNPICRYYPPGTHWVCLEVKDAAGCADTVCKSFVVPQKPVKLDSFIEIANVFTPSDPGDGYNDVFLVPCQGCSSFDIQIYNRWGEKVFQSKDPAVSWNGRVNNKGPMLPSGTYVYMLRYALGSAPVKSLNGTITLLGKQ
ncbi:MAG: gliding motility-associated C-terminal domain-containing protein [Bacteroidota bacterium]